jgi:hypothetical protein
MMRTMALRTFKSFTGFCGVLFDLLRGPNLLLTLARTDPKFREKILLTVTATNNCYG